jgi:hypothetical protein
VPLNAPMINTPLSFIALHSVITSQHLKFLQSKTSDTFDHIILTVICAVKNVCRTKYHLDNSNIKYFSNCYSQWQVLKKHTQKDGASQSLNGMSKRPRSIHSPKANFHTKNS